MKLLLEKKTRVTKQFLTISAQYEFGNEEQSHVAIFNYVLEPVMSLTPNDFSCFPKLPFE